MEQKMMLQMLEENREAYRANRPVTADMDLSIFRDFYSGKSAMQIAKAMPCAESTVYRAVRRVRDFLEVPNLAPFLQLLEQHIAEHQPDYGDWDAKCALEMVYVAYSDYNPIGPRNTHETFRVLRSVLERLPKEIADQIFGMICDLCNSHERSAFVEGMKLGVHLADELGC